MSADLAQRSRIPIDQLIRFMDQEIASGKDRMQKACDARKMRPETMDLLLRNLCAVRNRLRDLEAVFEVFPDASKIVAEPPRGR